ncbi:OLC1v1038290C1 [Oldenlandia corymbosa var. corymbosa]|uniref:OLC1v1038290C1 n=1 Tax=Oldenlandia corymbosa var. corymbosa TaxID=529605 RepID=A0AAV1D1R5_OLDCO|nr:OLC1v1038290C1 [Oldenlandia corymbosa var. corymbosa]
MALLQLHFKITTTSSAIPATGLLSSISPAIPLNSFSRLCRNHPFAVLPKSTGGCKVDYKPCSLMKARRDTLIAKAADVADAGSSEPSSESEDEENIPIQNLPLESKLQLKLEQKLKMKLAKKIRLRRKRLVRKRRLRKKGRWPPSKLKKNKNV